MLDRVKINSIKHMQTKANNLLNPYRYHLSQSAQKKLSWLYVLYYECEQNVTKTSRKIGVSRQWLSSMKSVFEKHNRDPRILEPESRAPLKTDQRKKIFPETEKLIIKIRDRFPVWGKEKISRLLRRDYKVQASPSTVNRYLHKHHKINPKISAKNKRSWQNKKLRENIQPSLKVKYRPPKKIKDYKPGALIEKDMKFVLKLGQFNNTEKYSSKENFYYQQTMIDSFTRFRVMELVQDAESKTAAIAYEKSKKRLPFSVACLNTDNGGENEKYFSEHLQTENIFHFYSNAGSPTDNPRVERSHLTDDLEFYRQGNLAKNFSHLKPALKKWEWTYNYYRPHQALDYLTPIEFYNLWKRNSPKAYKIVEKYQEYLKRQRQRLANSRRVKKKQQIENLLKFIDAKLTQKSNLNFYKSSLIKCQLCSWT